MSKTITNRWLYLLALIPCLSAVCVGQTAAPTPKPEATPSSTIEAWRTALPRAEQPPSYNDESVTNAAPNEESAADSEKRLGALERRWLVAAGAQNLTVIEKLLADDFKLTSPATTIAPADKQQYLKNIVPTGQFKNYKLADLTVQIYGTTAIVHLRLTPQAIVGIASNAPSRDDLWLTDVWLRTGGAWRVAARHLSPVSDKAVQ